MLRRLFAVLLAIVILILVVGFFLPRQIVVERSLVIDQPAEVLFEVLQDFRHFRHWSPWLDRVSAADFRLEGPPAGTGATLVWSGESDGGGGRMWIVSVSPPQRIDLALELGETEAEGYFLIDESAGFGHEVTWGLRFEVGTFDLVGRYIGLMLPALIGPDYQQGLVRLSEYLDQTPGRVPDVGDPEEEGSS
ncbi:MAG: hypothetical protein EA419_05125 [Wenzhouxiangella sp.]|nr:MAG: hypothetical protein EA419_05125 [Wenzhouxiangella sp.]